VATVSADGTPRIRSVVLRGFDEATRKPRFYTGMISRKAAGIVEAAVIIDRPGTSGVGSWRKLCKVRIPDARRALVWN
jgi:pyridoxine/pyridoxamine 5'-phosphate oxidase